MEKSHELISRKEALSLGLARYYTGKPCNRGHIAPRYTSDYSCAECAKILSSNYRARHPDKYKEQYRAHNERAKQKYKEDASFRQACLDRAKKWADQNRDKYLSYQRDWYQKNREAQLEYCRARYIKNMQDPAWLAKERERKRMEHIKHPERKRSAVRRRRARAANAQGSHNANDIKRILESQGGVCVYCKSSLDDGYEVDHVVPLSRGGSNSPENLQCLCPSCNGSKWARTHEEFLDYLEKRSRA